MIRRQLNNIIFILLITVFCFKSNGIQADNKNQFKISILTIGEGSDLVDAFGHSAIRVRNLNKTIDEVFNFGVYDFNAPNFILNFIKGRPQYKLDTESYFDFTQKYIYEERYIIEQELNLDKNSTNQIIKLLSENLKEPNYTYDYLKDNCATRVADIIVVRLNNIFNEKSLYNLDKNDEINSQSNYTFRKLIHSKISENTWGALGIDICLGAIIDKDISLRETFFLPEYIMNFLTDFENKNSNLVTKKIIYEPLNRTRYSENIPSPLFVISFLSIIFIIISIIDFKNANWTKLMDYIIFGFTGLIGILVIYLWFFSNHFAGSQNYNFLWAFPLNIILIYNISKKNIPKWTISYIKFLIILIILLFLHWITGVQKYNISLLPLFIALIFRYLFLINHINKIKNENLYKKR